MILPLVLNGMRPSLESIPRDVPKEIHALVKSCWNDQPAKRPHFRDLVDKFYSYVHGSDKESTIKSNKDMVLSTCYKRSIQDSIQENSDHSQKIKRVSCMFYEYLRRTDEIVAILFENKSVSQHDLESHSAEKTFHKKAQFLLEVLGGKPVSAYQRFLVALDATSQHYLHRLLEENEFELEIRHKLQLIDNFTYLKANITHTDSALLDNFLRVGVLNERELSGIKSANTDHERTDMLLQHILRSSFQQYEQFLEALKIANHVHVYKKLKDEAQIKEYRLDDPNQLDDIKEEEDYNASLLMGSLSLRDILLEKGEFRGTAILDNELFVAQGADEEVYVYHNTDNFSFIRKENIPRSRISTIVACLHNHCLYLSDNKQKMIHRLEYKSNNLRWPWNMFFTNKVVTKWAVGEKCFGLSVTKSYSILATLCDKRCVHEYQSDGTLIREINLDSSLSYPLHCVQLSNNQLIICHGQWATEHRLCVIDTAGKEIKSYGGIKGSEIGSMNGPRHIAVDKNDFILVADCHNDRVELLNPNLIHLRYLQIPDGHQLKGPVAVHFDELSQRLYIGEWGGKRLFILDVIEQ